MFLVFLLLILLFSITLLVVYVAGLPEEQQERFRSNPFLRLFLCAAKAARETESTPRSALADHPETTPEQTREPIDAEARSNRQVLGVALTGALMMTPALVVALFFKSSAFPGLLLPISTAAAGAIGFRAAKLSWRQIVLAAVLAGVGILPFAGFLGLGVSWGVFLLPLFDPAVRQAGPAPSIGMVTAIALALSAPFLLLLAASSSGRPYDIGEALFFGGLILGIPLILSNILLVVGLTVALFAPRAVAGPWIGGVGILSACIFVRLLVVAA